MTVKGLFVHLYFAETAPIMICDRILGNTVSLPIVAVCSEPLKQTLSDPGA